jgi:hypothetical protein
MDPRTTRFTDRLAMLFENDGQPPIAGRIFGLLLLSDDALSLDELAEDLGVSKAPSGSSPACSPSSAWSSRSAVRGAGGTTTGWRPISSSGPWRSAWRAGGGSPR